MPIKKRLDDAVWVGRWIKTTLDLVGWWTPVSVLLAAIGTGAWGSIQGLPRSLIVVTTLCAGIAAVYASLLPSLIRLLNRGAVYRKPDYDLWRHADILHIRQAACLLADINWVEGSKALYPEKARIWAHHLALAVESGQIRNLSGDTSRPADYETKIPVSDLRTWAKGKQIDAPYLTYLMRLDAHSPQASY
jgi:hypothetical protein